MVDNNTDKILGATLVGYETELVTCFISDGSRGDLAVAGAVCAYPSHLEALPRARLLIGEDMPTCPNM